MVENKQNADNLGFERMIAAHRGAQRGYWLYAALLFGVGALLVITAFTGHLSWLLGIVTGLMAMAISVLPMQQAVERGERIEGLMVLREEWAVLAERGDDADDQRTQFLALMRRLYA